jgi:hypothetical protein
MKGRKVQLPIRNAREQRPFVHEEGRQIYERENNIMAPKARYKNSNINNEAKRGDMVPGAENLY